ncbi:MAG: hypothetical protein PHD43_02305 [Methylococcales bacterium]|nr:hypothetical protein [Methylococcales bacterium]
MIQLPLEIIRTGFRADGDPRKAQWSRDSNPAVLVNSAVTQHLEVLGLARGRRLRKIEAIGHDSHNDAGGVAVVVAAGD